VPYTLRVEVRSGTIRLLVDGVAIGTLAQNLQPLPGTIGIRSNSPASTTTTGQHIERLSATNIATADVLSIVTPVEYKVFQRGGVTGAVRTSGRYPTGTAAIEGRIRAFAGGAVVRDWVPLAGAVLSANAFSGAVPDVPQGGWYTIELRAKDAGGAVIATTAETGRRFGVGIVVVTIGSSTTAGAMSRAEGSEASPEPLCAHVEDAAGNWGQHVAAGVARGRLAKALVAATGVPVAVLNLAQPGSFLGDWAAGNAPWTVFTSRLAFLTGDNRCEFVLGSHGQNDASNGLVASVAQHRGQWHALIAAIRALAGQPELPLLIWGIQRYPAALAAGASVSNARAAEQALPGEIAGVHYLFSTVTMAMGADNIHLASASFPVLGDWIADAATRLLYAGGEWRAPVIEGARRVDDSHIDVAIQQYRGGDFTPASAITGFEISADNFATTIAVSAAARRDAGAIRLTHASSASPLRLRYQAGADPAIGGAVKDDSARALPLAPTIGSIAVARPGSGGPHGGALATGMRIGM